MTPSDAPALASLPYQFPEELPEAFRCYRGVLLDIDGTLADSNLIHAQTWQQALEEGGYPATVAQVYRLIGKGADWLLPELAGVQSESAEGKQLSSRQSELFMRRLGEIQPFGGIREFIERLLKQGDLLAVASSGSPEHVSATLRQIGLADLLQPLPERLIPDTSKPAPDVIEQAAQSIGLSAPDCVMIGDTLYDVEAAQRAGSGFWPVRTNPVWAHDPLFNGFNH